MTNINERIDKLRGAPGVWGTITLPKHWLAVGAPRRVVDDALNDPDFPKNAIVIPTIHREFVDELGDPIEEIEGGIAYFNAEAEESRDLFYRALVESFDDAIRAAPRMTCVTFAIVGV